MSVISLAAEKEKREPHWTGQAICIGCRNEWQSVAPLGIYTGLECPKCLLPKGVTKWPFGADAGDAEFRCNCGCEALTAYKRKGNFYIRCMACGEDQTNALYD